MHEIRFEVNGREQEATVDGRSTLADLLREHLGLTGTHVGCEHGVCGACTVLVDGLAVRACLMLAVQAHGKCLLTVEGLADGGTLHLVQQAFLDSGSFQCGFCTPGFIMTTVELVQAGRLLSDPDIRHALAGNICRCTGYQSVLAGVRLALDLVSRPEGEFR